MEHKVYPSGKRTGSPIAVLQGSHLYYGAYASGMAVATVSGTYITLTGIGGGGIDYIIDGNRIMNSRNNQQIFTIQGEYSYDGQGGQPFLWCPTGDFNALAAASCFLAGDNRMRTYSSHPVSQRECPINAKGGSHNTFNQPDRFYGEKGPQSLSNQFGDKNWSRNANENFDNMRTPNGCGNNSNQVANSRASEPVREEIDYIANDRAYYESHPSPPPATWEEIEENRRRQELRDHDTFLLREYMKTPKYIKNRKIVDNLTSRELEKRNRPYKIYLKIIYAAIIACIVASCVYYEKFFDMIYYYPLSTFFLGPPAMLFIFVVFKTLIEWAKHGWDGYNEYANKLATEYDVNWSDFYTWTWIEILEKTGIHDDDGSYEESAIKK